MRRYVEVEDGRQEGFGEVVVRVSPGQGRKQRFSGVLPGEWGRSTSKRVEVFRAYRTLHIAQSRGELRDLLPAELYDMVADAVDQPAIEDLDI